mmetsp:Transcript_20440/g.49625  ORF Transcript_20440/g.49625 Transcript_20440/m.49625 type:complete len:512 (+) Transcript_20440:402-1937(+)
MVINFVATVLLAIGNLACPTCTGEDDVGSVADRFDEAMLTDDVILTALLAEVDGAVVPTPEGIAVGLVRAFSVSDLQGRAQAHRLASTNPRAVGSFVKHVSQIEDESGKIPEGFHSRFLQWREAVIQAGPVDVALTTENAMNAQLLACLKLSKTMQVDLASVSDELVCSLYGDVQGLSVTGPRSVSFDWGMLLRRWNVQSFKWNPGMFRSTGSNEARQLNTAVLQAPSLQALDVNHNQMDDAALQEMVQALKALQTIDLSYNKITEDGASTVGAIIETSEKLTSINLSNNHMSSVGVKKLADAVAKSKSLQTWGMSAMVTDQSPSRDMTGFLAIIDAIKKCKSLQRIDLSANVINDEAIGKLSGAIAVASALKIINLSSNQIQAGGAAALVLALKATARIEVIDLGYNDLGDSGMKDLADLLRNAPHLREPSLARNRITAAGAGDLAEALRHAKALKSIDLCYNKIADVGARKLVPAVAEATGLEYMNLKYNETWHANHDFRAIAHCKVDI